MPSGKSGKKKKAPQGDTNPPGSAAAAAGEETPEELKTRANALVATSDHAGAMLLLNKAINMHPSDLHLYYSNRSLCAVSLQKFDLAVDDANKCIALKPDWPKGYSRLGAALFFCGQTNDAAKAYAQGLSVDPTNETLLQGLQSANAALKQAPTPTPTPTSPTAAANGKAPADPNAPMPPPPPPTAPTPKGDAPKAESAPKEAAGSGPVVGIDLGTTYSCVACTIAGAGRVEVIQNEDGSRTTPSWVAFSAQDGTRLVGQGAKNQAAANPTNTVNDAKRLIGRSFKDSGVQSDMAHFSYKVLEGDDGKPAITLESSAWDKPRAFAPEQVTRHDETLGLSRSSPPPDLASSPPPCRLLISPPHRLFLASSPPPARTFLADLGDGARAAEGGRGGIPRRARHARGDHRARPLQRCAAASD